MARRNYCWAVKKTAGCRCRQYVDVTHGTYTSNPRQIALFATLKEIRDPVNFRLREDEIPVKVQLVEVA